MPLTSCQAGVLLPKCSFDLSEWNKVDAVRLCKNCVKRMCSRCEEWKQKHEFAIEDWRQEGVDLVCAECAQKKRKNNIWKCSRCRHQKPKGLFNLYVEDIELMGRRVRPGSLRCNACFTEQRDAEAKSARTSSERVTKHE